MKRERNIDDGRYASLDDWAPIHSVEIFGKLDLITHYEELKAHGGLTASGKSRAKILFGRNYRYLQSYNTVVAAVINGWYFRLWRGWSRSTANHENSFCYANRVRSYITDYSDGVRYVSGVIGGDVHEWADRCGKEIPLRLNEADTKVVLANELELPENLRYPGSNLRLYNYHIYGREVYKVVPPYSYWYRAKKNRLVQNFTKYEDALDYIEQVRRMEIVNEQIGRLRDATRMAA